MCRHIDDAPCRQNTTHIYSYASTLTYVPDVADGIWVYICVYIYAWDYSKLLTPNFFFACCYREALFSYSLLFTVWNGLFNIKYICLFTPVFLSLTKANFPTKKKVHKREKEKWNKKTSKYKIGILFSIQ